MKVGILGSGIVGQTLGSGFIKYGHQVKIGTSNSNKLNDWLKSSGSNASVGSFTDAASFGEIIVLAVKGTAAISVLEKAGSENLKEKTVIDTTNPIAEPPPVNGVLQFFTNQNSSLMEELQKKHLQANFVKAFSCVGNALMVNPDFGGQKPTMFIAGNNDDSKNVVKKFWILLDGKLKIWERQKQLVQLSRFAFCGVYRDLYKTDGRMPLNC